MFVIFLVLYYIFKIPFFPLKKDVVFYEKLELGDYKTKAPKR